MKERIDDKVKEVEGFLSDLESYPAAKTAAFKPRMGPRFAAVSPTSEQTSDFSLRYTQEVGDVPDSLEEYSKYPYFCVWKVKKK